MSKSSPDEMYSPKRRRVVLAKPGLDGHDRGAKVIARLLRDDGFEVVYTGLRLVPRAIAHIAVQEDADILAMSIMSGAHITLVKAVIAELDAMGVSDLPIIVGGTITPDDGTILRTLGVVAVFGVDAKHKDILRDFRRVATGARVAQGQKEN